MIKHIIQSNDKECQIEIGIISIIEWVNVNFAVPDKSGTYIVAFRDGTTKEVEFRIDDFYELLFGKNARIFNLRWYSNGESLTPHSAIDICREPFVWFIENIDPNEFDSEAYILTKDDFMYWLDTEYVYNGPKTLNNTDSIPIHTTYFGDAPFASLYEHL